MAHGKNAQKKYDLQWWKRRPFRGFTVSNNSGVNKFFKRLTHKAERQQGKKQSNDC